jgi:hypothetical protein
MEGFVRISCGALCRIPHPNANLLLLGINRNLSRKGQTVLKPIGGVLAFKPSALPSALTPTLEDSNRTELRLFLPEVQIKLFADWFAARTGRETSPFRELREELVEEYHVLPALKPPEVEMRYERTIKTQRLTDRAGATGLLTHSYQEIFTVRFTYPDQRRQLLKVTPDSGLYWVSEDHIRAGQLNAEIGIQAKILLDHTDAIP